MGEEKKKSSQHGTQHTDRCNNKPSKTFSGNRFPWYQYAENHAATMCWTNMRGRESPYDSRHENQLPGTRARLLTQSSRISNWEKRTAKCNWAFLQVGKCRNYICRKWKAHERLPLFWEDIQQDFEACLQKSQSVSIPGKVWWGWSLSVVVFHIAELFIGLAVFQLVLFSIFLTAKNLIFAHFDCKGGEMLIYLSKSSLSIP